MRTSAAIALAALITVISADGVPTCARPCVNQFSTGSSIAGCNSLDTHCICSNQDFLSNIACCLIDKCDEAGRTAAIAYAKSICATADPPVDVPSEVVCSSSSSSSKGTAAATTGGSTTGGATTAAPTGVTSTPTSAAQTSSSSGAAMVNMGSSGMGLAGGFAVALVLL
ncbi:hypothetical protein VE03_03719 [Pseudogymnoascus sp. 23342-1-I1]|nr:hypothetical protein VE03_03719 [Pseudogymnoascus sp. 23342-1-I1]